MTIKKKIERSQLREDEKITPALLDEIMHECLRGGLRIPSQPALERLATILEDWRQRYIGSTIFDPLKKELGLAVGCTKETLLKLRSEYGFGVDAVPEIRSKIDVIDHALAAMRSLQAEGIAVETARPLKWHWLDQALPGDFATAIQSTNPDYVIGISDNGPLTRFIAAVVPVLTGEQPTARSASTQLKVLRMKAHGR